MPGQRVRVTAGAYAGLRGRVDQVHRFAVVVVLDGVGPAAIAENWLEKV